MNIVSRITNLCSGQRKGIFFFKGLLACECLMEGVIIMAGELGPTFSCIMALLMSASVTCSSAQTPQEEE